MKEIAFLIEKVNSGIRFTAEITGNGPAPKIMCDACGAKRTKPGPHVNGNGRQCGCRRFVLAYQSELREAFARAEAWYRKRAREAFAANGIADIGYAEQFESARSRYDGPYTTILDLEPWGFALTAEGKPIMGDTGSTPTTGRARVLLCHQAPLDAVHEGGMVAFRKRITAKDLT